MTELHVYPGDNIYIVVHGGTLEKTSRRFSLIIEDKQVTFIDDAANGGWGKEYGPITI